MKEQRNDGTMVRHHDGFLRRKTKKSVPASIKQPLKLRTGLARRLAAVGVPASADNLAGAGGHYQTTTKDGKRIGMTYPGSFKKNHADGLNKH